MRINNTGAFSNVRINYQDNQVRKSILAFEQRKKDASPVNSDLQRIWDDAERRRERLLAEKIARKIAKGAQVSFAERAFLEKTNPELLKKADDAKKAGDELKNRLKQAKTKEEVQRMVTESGSLVMEIGKRDAEYAGLVKEAHDGVLKEYKDSGEYKSLPDKEEDKRRKNRNEGEGSLVDYHC